MIKFHVWIAPLMLYPYQRVNTPFRVVRAIPEALRTGLADTLRSHP